jgi:hypothetical protein
MHYYHKSIQLFYLITNVARILFYRKGRKVRRGGFSKFTKKNIPLRSLRNFSSCSLRLNTFLPNVN